LRKRILEFQNVFRKDFFYFRCKIVNNICSVLDTYHVFFIRFLFLSNLRLLIKIFGMYRNCSPASEAYTIEFLCEISIYLICCCQRVFFFFSLKYLKKLSFNCCHHVHHYQKNLRYNINELILRTYIWEKLRSINDFPHLFIHTEPA